VNEENSIADDSAVDSSIAMKEFADEIRERAKLMSRGSVERSRPELAIRALWMLAQGARISEIAKLTGLGHETIRRLEWNHNDTLETKRKQFSVRYAMAAAEFTDLLFQRAEGLAQDPSELAKISPDKLALVIGIMTDKSSQLTGMATTVIEHRKGASIEDAAKMIEDAKKRVADKVRSEAIDAEIVE
jgi:hypothetical protein